MRVTLQDNLPFTTIKISFQNIAIYIPNILVDTGSATTVIATDVVEPLQIQPTPEKSLYVIRGVGGTEVVFSHFLDYLQVGEYKISNFEIEIGEMDYGFRINGILGMDFLMQTGAILDLQQLNLQFAS